MIVENGQYNIRHICTKQQCENGFADKIAFHWFLTSGKI